MVEAPSPAAAGSRPSFSSFWKRTKEASASASRQVTFVPIDIPHIAKGRSAKKQIKALPPADAQDIFRSSDSTHLGGSGGDQGEEAGMEGQESGEAAHSSEEHGQSPEGSSNRTAKEKAQVRRAQVRRAQIQHRKRKADYMRQLELDIDMLRDLITTTEQDMKNIQKDNNAIRMQLGIVTVAPNDRSTFNVGAGAVGFIEGGGEGGRERANVDTTMCDVPAVAVTPAPPRRAVAADGAAADNVASSLSPLSISPNNIASSTSPSGTGHTSTSYDSMDSPSSIFTGIDLDDINVSIVVDKAVGNPVYQISSISPDMLLTTFPDNFNDPLTQGLPVSPFDPGFVPTFETEIASSSQPLAGRDVAHSTTAFFLPDLTVTETHSIVNLILALEHVCWGHAGHQYHEDTSKADSNVRAEHGHSMMATSLFLREAPGKVFSKIETSTKGMGAFTTNMKPEDKEVTRNYADSHQASQGVQWQAPDVTLQTLYGLAVSLNPISDKELAPVQGWFELASRYPLSLLLREDIVENLKREMVGVVRCLYFGAVMEREAFESVVQRVVEPAMQAIEASQTTA